jgi:two-component system, chemotaxis family, response regulator Rcp1
MSLDVLLVEDNPGDVRLTQEAFRAADQAIHLHVAADGLEAMDFLRREGNHSRAPRPALILLDLGLPGMDGHEVLARIKTDDDLKMIPTVILSTNQAEADIDTSYQLHANCYLAKPVLADDLDRIISRINNFWLRNLPSHTTAVN